MACAPTSHLISARLDSTRLVSSLHFFPTLFASFAFMWAFFPLLFLFLFFYFCFLFEPIFLFSLYIYNIMFVPYSEKGRLEKSKIGAVQMIGRHIYTFKQILSVVGKIMFGVNFSPQRVLQQWIRYVVHGAKKLVRLFAASIKHI